MATIVADDKKAPPMQPHRVVHGSINLGYDRETGEAKRIEKGDVFTPTDARERDRMLEAGTLEPV